MKIKPLELERFLKDELIGSKALEGSEIITLYEQASVRKSMRQAIHMALSKPLRPINKYIHDKDELINTYIPQINFGRCQGHTTAIAEYLQESETVDTITVVVYDSHFIDSFKGFIRTPRGKHNYQIMSAYSFKRVTDYSLHPHVIFDSRLTLDMLHTESVLLLLMNSKVVCLGV